MNTIIVNDFSLEYTLDSGQFFYYKLIDDFYYIVQNDTIFKIRQNENKLFYLGVNVDDNYIMNFFGLNDNLKALTDDFKQDYYLNLAREKYYGLRSQNLDLWQTIVSFVLSSASNIPKIQMNIILLSEYFGERIEFDGLIFYTFPKIGSFNNLDKIKEAKTGFRAKYLFAINDLISKNPDILSKIKSSNYLVAKKLLMQFPGIGSKVADCICLFSLNKKEVFPVDTWVKQIIEKLYLKRNAKNLLEIEKCINDTFIVNKGIKQQYLFLWARYNLK